MAKGYSRQDLPELFKHCKANVRRVAAANFTEASPAVIAGAMDDWPAMEMWSVESFCRDFGRHMLVGCSSNDLDRRS